MSLAERERVLPKPSDRSLARETLRVHFHRFAAGQIGGDMSELVSFPDFTLENGSINSGWLSWFKDYNRRVASQNPGTLRIDPQTKEYTALDKASPIGEIEELKKFAQSYISNDNPNLYSPQELKDAEKLARGELVDIFNSYAGLRFNGVRDIANGKDFRGVNLAYVAARSLSAWRQDLLRARQQSAILSLFDRWEDADRKIQTPTRADHFFFTLFSELVATPKESLSERAQSLQRLLDLDLDPILSYKEIADMFYAGDMHKTFINLSAVAKMTGLRLPEGWQAFQGSTGEFRTLREKLSSVKPGLDGYLEAADDLYAGDMLKTFQNLSAVAKMTGLRLPEGWQEFQGSTGEFRTLREKLSSVKPGLDGYLEAADDLYAGDMLKTFINLSAVAKMTGQKLPEGWQEFHGSTGEFRTLREKLSSVKPGLDGYLEAADDLYAGDMVKTFINLSAVAKMTGLRLPEGWQAFQGSTREFRTQYEWLIKNPSSTREEYITQFKTEGYKGRLNYAALKNMAEYQA